MRNIKKEIITNEIEVEDVYCDFCTELIGTTNRDEILTKGDLAEIEIKLTSKIEDHKCKYFELNDVCLKCGEKFVVELEGMLGKLFKSK